MLRLRSALASSKSVPSGIFPSVYPEDHHVVVQVASSSERWLASFSNGTMKPPPSGTVTTPAIGPHSSRGPIASLFGVLAQVPRSTPARRAVDRQCGSRGHSAWSWLPFPDQQRLSISQSAQPRSVRWHRARKAKRGTRSPLLEERCTRLTANSLCVKCSIGSGIRFRKGPPGKECGKSAKGTISLSKPHGTQYSHCHLRRPRRCSGGDTRPEQHNGRHWGRHPNTRLVRSGRRRCD